MLIFNGRVKPEYPEKNLSEQGGDQQQTQPTYDAESGNQTRATLVGGESSHHCAIPTPRKSVANPLKRSERTVEQKTEEGPLNFRHKTETVQL